MNVFLKKIKNVDKIKKR